MLNRKLHRVLVDIKFIGANRFLFFTILLLGQLLGFYDDDGGISWVIGSIKFTSI